MASVVLEKSTQVHIKVLPSTRSWKSPRMTSVFSSETPVLFYCDYQREQCLSSKDHYGFIRGECKLLKDICAACWTCLCKQESHQKNSSDYPLATKDSCSPPGFTRTEAGGMSAIDISRGSSAFYSRLFVARLSYY